MNKTVSSSSEQFSPEDAAMRQEQTQSALTNLVEMGWLTQEDAQKVKEALQVLFDSKVEYILSLGRPNPVMDTVHDMVMLGIPAPQFAVAATEVLQGILVESIGMEGIAACLAERKVLNKLMKDALMISSLTGIPMENSVVLMKDMVDSARSFVQGTMADEGISPEDKISQLKAVSREKAKEMVEKIKNLFGDSEVIPVYSPETLQVMGKETQAELDEHLSKCDCEKQ